MDLNELRSLDVKDLARAPLPVRLVALVLLFLAVVGVGYYLVWADGMAEVERLRNEEADLRETYAQKRRQAIHYEAYKMRLADLERSLATLLRQLPNKAEMDALLTDINQAGVGRGLEFELFRPGQEALADFYVTLPVTVRVKGDYHDMAGFVSDLAQMPRIVTLHDVSLNPVSEGSGLVMEATLRTYRYLDEAELEAAGKDKKDDKKP
ncbi:MAG: type 4a pilus biogenesis protein PilO [Thiobacillaceae bacterium]|nr:type 4a pilus biogenesis protein PilO [Thiobacillaceae bacterium]